MCLKCNISYIKIQILSIISRCFIIRSSFSNRIYSNGDHFVKSANDETKYLSPAFCSLGWFRCLLWTWFKSKYICKSTSKSTRIFLLSIASRFLPETSRPWVGVGVTKCDGRLRIKCTVRIMVMPAHPRNKSISIASAGDKVTRQSLSSSVLE